MLSLVNENQLDQWVRANARDAQGVIVELIWRLVAASCPRPQERRFPLGDSIGQHGPDGILKVALGFEPFVPDGLSYWEIGTGLKAGDKATSDYTALTEEVPEHKRREATFVFVTPLSGRRDWEHTWKKEAQAAWLEERRERGEWKDVRVLDGTKLIDWLRHFLPVELWLAQKMGILPRQGIETAEQRWDIVKSIGEPPPLIPEIFLANRDEARAKLKDLFDDKVVQIKLTTHFPDQVTDFVCACLASLDREARIDVTSRCLIVKTTDAWDAICASSAGGAKLILVADTTLDLSGHSGTILIQKARRAGYSVVFGGPHGGIPDSTSVPLLMPRPSHVQDALLKAGYSEERARTLAQKSGGNLSTLLRCLQNLSLLPEWAETSEAAELAVAMFLGSWRDESTADRAVIESLSGKPYGEWIGMMRDVSLRPATPLTHQDGDWKFLARYEGWYALGPRLFDEHLDRLKAAAVSVLRELDPQFELPPDQRYMAPIQKKVLRHSSLLRNGIAESLALLGSHSEALKSCSLGKAEATAILAVREILADADWTLWASLNDVLPLLAEAAPREFLNAVENALQRNPCPFDELFAQEGDGIVYRNYMSGLLWALETLAWDEEYLGRVVLCLGELAARDPGGRSANRPDSSLTAILLPRLPQTCAPIAKRVAAVKALVAQFPEVGWKLLVSLLPGNHLVSFATRRPAWRKTIPDDWRQGVTEVEYRKQVLDYADLAVTEAIKGVSRLVELIAHLERLPESAFHRLIEHLSSDAVLALSEDDRLRLWEALEDLVTEHTRASEDPSAMQRERISQIAAVAERLAPDTPFFRNQWLFGERAADLFEQPGNDEEQMKALEARRQRAIEEVAIAGGTSAVIEFATRVESPWRVGIAFGAVAGPDTDATLLPELLEAPQKPLIQFAGGYVRGRWQRYGWPWVDTIETGRWTSEQIGQFLSFLPFSPEAWERAQRLLGENQAAYWSRTSANPYEADAGLEFAVDQLLQHGRPHAAIRCLHKMLRDGQQLDNNKAVRALFEALNSAEPSHVMDDYHAVEIIKALQSDPNTAPEDLFRIEWAYLPLLNGHDDALPRFLWRALAYSPELFCQLIRLVFRSRKEEYRGGELTEERQRMAVNAYKLLTEWQFPPGLCEDGSYDGNALKEWLNAVKTECRETGHLEVAMDMVGQALIHVPPDPSGLWIHQSAAAVLDAKDAEDIRRGFMNGLYNMRGAHWVDPSGAPERELAAKYRAQADAVEVAGYLRLAGTLRELANSYEREAQWIVSRAREED